MIADFKTYPMMKDTGLPWLGKVPEHWEIRRLGALLRERRETNDDLRVTDVLSVLKDRGVIPYAEKGNVGNKKSDDISRYKIVRPYDIVVNCMNVIIGSVGLSKYTGCLSPVYYVLTRRKNQDDPHYLNACFQTKPFQQSLVRIGNGILAHRMRIPMELLRCEPFPRPPADEQAAIVRFLDYADRRIRRYIRIKQKLIKLLEEQKQAIIHRAVTRGLDPSVRLKPSGVEWLGDVPEHWEVVKFKRRVGFQEGPGIMAADFREEGVPLLRISCLRGQTASLSGCNFLDEDVVGRRWSRFAVRPGDYLLSASASTGNVVLATEVVAGAIPYTGILRLWPLSGAAFMPFVRLYMGCRPFQNQIDAAKAGVAIEHFGPTHLKRMSIALPSSTEQREIVEAVESQVAPFAAAIERTSREISLLLEYRTRLIADVVTGKLDVREAAARLPDEADESELLDEAPADASDSDVESIEVESEEEVS